MKRAGVLVLVTGLLAAGCGGKTATTTVTVTESSVTTSTTTSSDAPSPTDAGSVFCASAMGDSLAQAESEAEGALNHQAAQQFLGITRRAERIALAAPYGADCAAHALNWIASYLNLGAGGNLAAIDAPAEVRRIRSIQHRRHLAIEHIS